MDCGRFLEPWLMEFDHKPCETKVADVSAIVGNGTCSVRRLFVEMAKCEVVCVECHRRRTFAGRWNESLQRALAYLVKHRLELEKLMAAEANSVEAPR